MIGVLALALAILLWELSSVEMGPGLFILSAVLAVFLTGLLIWVILLAVKFSRPHVFSGVVKFGFNQGEKVGARTANLDSKLAKNMPQGLYACEVILGHEVYPGLLFYGFNSLVKQICLEVHILNFSGDIYGKMITVTTNKYLRPAKIFNTEEELKQQIKKDLAEAKKEK